MPRGGIQQGPSYGTMVIYANKGRRDGRCGRAGWSFLLALLYGVQGAEWCAFDQGKLKNDLAPVSISMMEAHLSRRALSRADESTIVRAARDFSDEALNMLVNIAGMQLHHINVNSLTRMDEWYSGMNKCIAGIVNVPRRSWVCGVLDNRERRKIYR